MSVLRRLLLQREKGYNGGLRALPFICCHYKEKFQLETLPSPRKQKALWLSEYKVCEGRRMPSKTAAWSHFAIIMEISGRELLSFLRCLRSVQLKF